MFEEYIQELTRQKKQLAKIKSKSDRTLRIGAWVDLNLAVFVAMSKFADVDREAWLAAGELKWDAYQRGRDAINA